MTVSSICNPHTFQGFNIGLKELRKFLKLQTHFLQPWAKPNFSIYWSRFLISAFVELLLPESRLIFTNKGTRREKGRSRSSSIRRDVINPFSVSLLARYGRWSECGWERGIEEMESISRILASSRVFISQRWLCRCAPSSCSCLKHTLTHTQYLNQLAWNNCTLCQVYSPPVFISDSRGNSGADPSDGTVNKRHEFYIWVAAHTPLAPSVKVMMSAKVR